MKLLRSRGSLGATAVSFCFLLAACSAGADPNRSADQFDPGAAAATEWSTLNPPLGIQQMNCGPDLAHQEPIASYFYTNASYYNASICASVANSQGLVYTAPSVLGEAMVIDSPSLQSVDSESIADWRLADTIGGTDDDPTATNGETGLFGFGWLRKDHADYWWSGLGQDDVFGYTYKVKTPGVLENKSVTFDFGTPSSDFKCGSDTSPFIYCGTPMLGQQVGKDNYLRSFQVGVWPITLRLVN